MALVTEDLRPNERMSEASSATPVQPLRPPFSDSEVEATPFTSGLSRP
jgi:hypothetical protein